MVGTIVPVVYGARGLRKWLIAISLYLFGSVLAGAVVGLLFGFIGQRLAFDQVPWNQPALGLLGVLCLLYALHELQILQFPYPERREQVNNTWRYRFHPFVVAFLYGLGLGAGFLTFVAVGTVYVVMVGSLLSGDPFYGAMLCGTFGLARALYLALLGWRIRTSAQSEKLLRRMSFVSQIIHLVNGLALAFSGAFAITGFMQRLF